MKYLKNQTQENIKGKKKTTAADDLWRDGFFKK